MHEVGGSHRLAYSLDLTVRRKCIPVNDCYGFLLASICVVSPLMITSNGKLNMLSFDVSFSPFAEVDD